MNSSLNVETKYPGRADLLAFFRQKASMPIHRRLWASARRLVGADPMKAYTICIFVPNPPVTIP